MVDYRVRFVGDLGNLKQFDSAVQNSLGASSRALEAANLRVAQSAGAGTTKLFDPKTDATTAGRFSRNIKTEIDSINRTFIQSGEQFRRYISGYVQEINKETGQIHLVPEFKEEYIGSYKKIIGNYDSYLDAITRVQRTEARIFGLQEAERKRHETALNTIQATKNSKATEKGVLSKALKNLAVQDITDKENYGYTYDSVIKRYQNQIDQIRLGTGINVNKVKPSKPLGADLIPGVTGFQTVTDIQRQIDERRNDIQQANAPGRIPLNTGTIARMEAEITQLEQILARAPSRINASVAPLSRALGRYQGEIQSETESIRQTITAYEREIARLEGVDAQQQALLRRRVAALKAANPAYQQLDRATSATPPVNPNLQKALNLSPQLRKQLLQGGLGEGINNVPAKYNLGAESDFAKNLAMQEANVTKFVRNMRTGVISVEGELKRFNALTGSFDQVEKFTADIDKNGKVITRWGGQLSGAGSILKQTVRDFQKVIEWTIATTLVFGTLGLVISQLKSINDLNTSLTRFSITAQTSVGEARDIFQDLGRVAINTATPLGDLIKVADDIALATKTAGDSTEEWRGKIIDLTTAVGIFTNLTGEDTVQGADKLTSAFKQLSIAPKDLIGVLNQVTAVAGGQSTAINDIVTALGGVGEAGKAAQLTIEQQIALVQVLGQVTNKSAADTATSFKNLFGAISSPGSEKILKEFGISIRDAATGGLKPFLTIYREINKALETGVIPLTRYQDVLRGISGGPRRAPDAAALLGNLPAVEAAIVRATGATNEALIANAKILDTNAAKIQQLQNAFDIALFNKFGEAVQRATGGITDLLTGLLDLFNKIDPSTVSLLLTLGAITVAAKALSILFGKIGLIAIGSFANISKSVRTATVDLKTMIQEETVSNAVRRGQVQLGPVNPLLLNPIGPLGSRILKNPGQGTGLAPTSSVYSLRNVAAGVAVGSARNVLQSIESLGPKKGLAALGATAIGITAVGNALTSTEQSAKQTSGQILQLLGTLGLMVPGLQALSLAALASGIGLQFLGNDTQEAQQSSHDLAVSVYESVQKLKDARATVVETEKAQASAKKQLDAALALSAKDVSAKDAQTQATSAFVTATLALADANKVASDSFDELIAKIGGAGDTYKLYKSITKSSSQADIDKLSQELAGQILGIQGKGRYVAGPISTTYKQVPLTAPIPQAPTLNQDLQFKPEYLQPQNLFKLFDQSGAQTGIQIPVSAQNLSALNQSLQDIISGKAKVDFNQEQIDTLQKAVNDFLTANSSYFEIQAKLASDAARVQALSAVGALSGEQTNNANLRIAGAKALQDLLGSYKPPPSTLLDRGGKETGSSASGLTEQKVLELIQKLRDGVATGAKLSDDEVKALGTDLLTMNGTIDILKRTGDLAFRQGMAEALQKVGVSAEDVQRIFHLLPGELAKSEEEAARLQGIMDDFDKARGDAQTKYAARNAALQQQKNSGDFKGNAAGLSALQAQSEAAYVSETKLITSIQQLGQENLPALQAELSKVIGLENATTLSGDQLSAALIDQAVAAGVSGKGISKLKDEVLKLLTAVDTVAKIKAKFQIQGSVTMDLSHYIAAMKLLRNTTLAAIRGNPFISPGGAASALTGLNELNQAIAELERQAKVLNQVPKTINQINQSGGGSNFGKASGTTAASRAAKAAGPGLDVSNLDLPDEIANASNRDALIKLAIANARSLQSKIPGASKDAKNDVVELLKGTQRILEVRGVKDDLLRKALEELAAIEKKRLDFETKADTIRRIRIGSGSFAAIANVPVNTKTGVSLGSPGGPINVTLNLNGTVLTPAQLAQFADLVASALKRQIANG